MANTIEAALVRVEAILPGEPVDVFVNFTAGLPSDDRIGSGGQVVPSTGSIQVWVDPETPSRRLLSSYLPLLVAHEFHHSRRVTDGPGYGSTLGEVVISEGLAVWFEKETFPEVTDPRGPVTLTDIEATELTMRVCAEFDDTSFRSDEWFRGAGGLPLSAGYGVGEWMVDSFLEQAEMTAGESVAIPAAEIAAVACMN